MIHSIDRIIEPDFSYVYIPADVSKIEPDTPSRKHHGWAWAAGEVVAITAGNSAQGEINIVLKKPRCLLIYKGSKGDHNHIAVGWTYYDDEFDWCHIHAADWLHPASKAKSLRLGDFIFLAGVTFDTDGSYFNHSKNPRAWTERIKHGCDFDCQPCFTFSMQYWSTQFRLGYTRKNRMFFYLFRRAFDAFFYNYRFEKLIINLLFSLPINKSLLQKIKSAQLFS